jgi:pimeloyl-ACP methyl ester carboxylesterase
MHAAQAAARRGRPPKIRAAVAAVVLVVMFGWLVTAQRSLIYFPQPRTGPAAAVTLDVEGARLVVSVRPGDADRAVLYFGGNAEDVSHSVDSLAPAFPGAALYLPHYRGYGGSSGRPSEAALFADGLALFDDVHRRHPRVTLIGRSLGSGVAAYVASRRPVTRVVLVTPFESLAAVGARHYRILPVRLLLRDRFDSAAYAPAITAPTLLLAAADDTIIPPEHAAALLRAFPPGLATLEVLEGVDHNTIHLSPAYIGLLARGG